jgi:hypothetical protein
MDIERGDRQTRLRASLPDLRGRFDHAYWHAGDHGGVFREASYAEILPRRSR